MPPHNANTPIHYANQPLCSRTTKAPNHYACKPIHYAGQQPKSLLVTKATNQYSKNQLCKITTKQTSHYAQYYPIHHASLSLWTNHTAHNQNRPTWLAYLIFIWVGAPEICITKNEQICVYMLWINFAESVLLRTLWKNGTPAWRKYTTAGSGGSD